MTFNKLIMFGLLLVMIMGAVKIFFFRTFDWENAGMPHYVFWAIGMLYSIALVRRLGVISFLEAIVVCGVWIFLWALFDALITAPILGYAIFLDPTFLFGYFLVIVAIFFFHKKRHVQIRKELANHHH